jgi:hypothetical protein
MYIIYVMILNNFILDFKHMITVQSFILVYMHLMKTYFGVLLFSNKYTFLCAI